ncbi:hypothetical protein ABG299_001043 [Salmonella enterica subsp. enterica]
MPTHKHWFKDSNTGVIVQWGFSSTYGGSTIWFPVAFPSACFNVQVSPYSPGSTKTSEVAVQSYSTTSAVLIENSDNTEIFWLAIGY